MGAHVSLCSLKAVTRIGSDHVPLLSAWGDGAPPRSHRFHLEPSWLLHPGFIEMVKACWLETVASPPCIFCAVDVWHHYAKMARQLMRGWGANLVVELRAWKGAMLDQIRGLDEVYDSAGLSPNDWILR